MKGEHILYRSDKSEWETPQELFNKLDAVYHFETDVCALPENAKCKRFFTPEQDGLKQEWTGSCWCNPPYGRNVWKWVKKAYESDALTVMLFPVRTGTKWFHDYIYNHPGVSIEFLRGRLKFSGVKGEAPFPSMLIIFNRKGVK